MNLKDQYKILNESPSGLTDDYEGYSNGVQLMHFDSSDEIIDRYIGKVRMNPYRNNLIYLKAYFTDMASQSYNKLELYPDTLSDLKDTKTPEEIVKWFNDNNIKLCCVVWEKADSEKYKNWIKQKSDEVIYDVYYKLDKVLGVKFRYDAENTGGYDAAIIYRDDDAIKLRKRK